jgi:hypothetical protein
MGLPVTTPTADPPGAQARVRNPWAVARAAVAAPFTRRECRELLFCLAGLPFVVVVNPLALFVLAVDLTWLAAGTRHGNPSPADVAIACFCLGLLLVLLVSTRAARRLGSLQRMLATQLLGMRVAAPPVRQRPGGRTWPGPGPATRPAGGSWPTCWPSCRSA